MPDSLLLLTILVVVVALSFDFVNGWNDSANAIATVVGTRVLSPTAAVILAAVMNLAGAMVGTEVAKTLAGIIHIDTVPIENGLLIVMAGLLSAMVWAAWMTILGMPISGSHSLIGGIMGSAVAAAGVKILVAKKVGLTLLAMLCAPVMGFLMGYLLYVLLIRSTIRWRPTRMDRYFGKLQLLSAAWMAFTHGTNDAQKVMGIITMALITSRIQPTVPGGEFEVLLWVKISCALAISIGTAVGGWKVIKTLGHHLTKLGPTEGFTAETAGAAVLSLAAWLGLPTSTTHTITGSILGVGATRSISSVRWGMGTKIILAWVTTLPMTAVFGGVFYWLFVSFMKT